MERYLDTTQKKKLEHWVEKGFFDTPPAWFSFQSISEYVIWTSGELHLVFEGKSGVLRLTSLNLDLFVQKLLEVNPEVKTFTRLANQTLVVCGMEYPLPVGIHLPPAEQSKGFFRMFYEEDITVPVRLEDEVWKPEVLPHIEQGVYELLKRKYLSYLDLFRREVPYE